ncbi:cob(I)yrinic acid a,c-diamide adenosyltransferase [Clostridium sp. MD294]|uniref:cob(I)yrinic acid a,c-diamide adenosyltransferase n=1 Tax=Clostridium sp. MD294 TaxID=97138 RepID=UPI0002CA5EC3|nr:cob(I)yrinic acid a,c-diamide adenosyltransferase [Clostridium sp. MD294]USF31412.1 Corrinoid adenosyltransferase [Clostridium sp. MD294]
MVLLYTGKGKGKTTAAIGLCIRALGWGKKVCMIQFLKSPEFESGEIKLLKKLNVTLYQTGLGYSWTKTPQQQIDCIQKAWELCKKVLLCEKYDMIILDEIVNVFCMKTVCVSDFLTEENLIEVLQNTKKTMDIVLTGRNASTKLIEYADLVTEMKNIKHYYKKGIKAIKGLEY